MVQRLREAIGYPLAEGGGTVTPGTSVGNIMAINMALQKRFSNFRDQGFVGGKVPKFAIFSSAAASGSLEKAQIFGGKLT